MEPLSSCFFTSGPSDLVVSVGVVDGGAVAIVVITLLTTGSPGPDGVSVCGSIGSVVMATV